MPLSTFISNISSIAMLLLGSFIISLKFSILYSAVLVVPSSIMYFLSSLRVSNNGKIMLSGSNTLTINVSFAYKALDLIFIRSIVAALTNQFSIYSRRLRKAEASNYFLMQLPKIVLEAIFLISALLFVVRTPNAEIPALLGVVYAFQRISYVSNT